MSTPKQLVIFPTGSVTPKDRERMMRAGFVAIEAADPSNVIVAIPGQSFGDTDLLKIALGSMCADPYDTALRSRFVMRLWDSIKPKAP